jgi:hypothetical protein
VSTGRLPYVPGKVPAKGKKPGTETFSRLARRRWKFSNLGTWTIRDIRNKPGTMSQHATGRALDLGYPATKEGRAAALQACAWFVAYSNELGVALVNDYIHGRYGRTWISSRAAWKTHTSNTIGIRYHGIHVELHDWAAKMPAADYEAVWRSLPRP